MGGRAVNGRREFDILMAKRRSIAGREVDGQREVDGRERSRWAKGKLMVERDVDGREGS